MTRMPGNGSKGLGRRTFGTAGVRDTSRGMPERFGEAIDMVEEFLPKPIVLPVSREWKPRPGRIYNFPIRRTPDEK